LLLTNSWHTRYHLQLLLLLLLQLALHHVCLCFV
jgi:hypothetical protein